MKLALSEDLRYHSYERRRGQPAVISSEQSAKEGKKLLDKLNHLVEPGTGSFFSDKTNFYQDQLRNSQSNRWLAVNRHEVPRVMNTQFVRRWWSSIACPATAIPCLHTSLKKPSGSAPMTTWSCLARWCEALDGESGCRTAIHVAAGLGAMSHLRKSQKWL